MPMGKYGVYAELLDTAARIAVRSYTHCPQTARVYYKPPPTTTATARSNDGGNGRGAASSTSRSSGDGDGGREKAGAEASSARRKQLLQLRQEAAAKVAFDAAEVMLHGGV